MKIPKKGTKKYEAIVKLGCQSSRTWTNWGYEYDCVYDWGCDYCPIVVAKITRRSSHANNQVPG